MRMLAEDRIAQLRKAALEVAKMIGYRAVTRHHVGAHAKVSVSLVPYHLGDIATMKKNILHDACEEGDVKLIIEGVLEKDKVAMKAIHNHRNAIMKLLFGDK